MNFCSQRLRKKRDTRSNPKHTRRPFDRTTPEEVEGGTLRMLPRYPKFRNAIVNTNRNAESYNFKEHTHRNFIENWKIPVELLAQPKYVPPPQMEDFFGPRWISTEKGLENMLRDIQAKTEIQVNGEFARESGYLRQQPCILQISTLSKDYVVDLLELWQSINCLKAIFESHEILKVFYCGQDIILSLQLFFRIYTVAVVDIGIVEEMLQSHNANKKITFEELVSRYLSVSEKADMSIPDDADWTLRTLIKRKYMLDENMLRYARRRTHYGIRIWQHQKTQLSALHQNNDVKLIRLTERLVEFTKKTAEPVTYLSSTNLQPRDIQGDNASLYKSVYEWRDGVARSQDVPPSHVISDQTLFKIARTTQNPYMWPCPVGKQRKRWHHFATIDDISKLCKIISQFRIDMLRNARTFTPKIARSQPIASTSSSCRYDIGNMKFSRNRAFEESLNKPTVKNGEEQVENVFRDPDASKDKPESHDTERERLNRRKRL